MSGGRNKCVVCNKTVYENEEISFENQFFHDACFKCSICNKKIANNFFSADSMDGKIFHRSLSCFQTPEESEVRLLDSLVREHGKRQAFVYEALRVPLIPVLAKVASTYDVLDEQT